MTLSSVTKIITKHILYLNTDPTIQSYDKETEVTCSGTFQYLIQYNQCMRVGWEHPSKNL